MGNLIPPPGFRAHPPTGLERSWSQTTAGTVPDLIGGIELIMHGQKVAWSIADYLASLEKDVNELLKVRQKTEAVNSKPEEHGS